MRALIVPSVLVFGLALSTAACGDAEPDSPVVGQVSQPIIGGAKDTAAFNSVVDLLVNNEGFCSGTVFKIENNVTWILTAAHCIPANRVYVGVDIDMGQGGMTQYNVADSTKDQRWESDSVGGLPYDLGVVKVNQAIAGVTPIPLADAADGLAVGQSVVSHGYGTTEGYNQGQPDYRGVITRTISQLDSSYIVYDQSDMKGICSGDSGGPVIANGKVVGVHSTVGNQDPNAEQCFGEANSIRVSSRFDFIDAVVNGTALPTKSACGACVDDSSQSGVCAQKAEHCLQDDAECAALAECLQNGDPNTCTSQHPEGVGPYLDAAECGCADACTSECATDTTTCQGVAKCGVAFTGTKGITLTACLEENCCDETDAAAADGEAYVCLSDLSPPASCDSNAKYAAYAACKAAHCDTPKGSSSSGGSSSSSSSGSEGDDDTTGDDDTSADDDSTGTKKKASKDDGGCNTAPEGSPLGGLGLALGVALCLGRRRRAA